MAERAQKEFGKILQAVRLKISNAERHKGKTKECYTKEAEFRRRGKDNKNKERCKEERE
jgi:hypothetical protein